jgi:hypothetical protein
MSKDQVKNEVSKENQTQEAQESQADQSSQEQSKETDKSKGDGKIKPKSGLGQLVKGLQKGYTQTRQDIAGIKQLIEGLSNTDKVQVDEDSEEYVTVGKLKEILSEHSNSQTKKAQAEKDKADKYVKEARREGLKQKDDKKLLF